MFNLNIFTQDDKFIGDKLMEDVNLDAPVKKMAVYSSFTNFFYRHFSPAKSKNNQSYIKPTFYLLGNSYKA